MKIHLKGYYGYGNFGDDLLMIAAYNLLNEVFIDAKIFIFSKKKYVFNLLPNAIDIEEIKIENNDLDLIVYGGGGLYFDFVKGDLKSFILNKTINLFHGDNVNKIRNYIKKNKKQNTEKIAIGIGVGPYSKTSKKYFNQMRYLSSFKLICVRDVKSYNFCKRNNKNTYLYSDLVFGQKYWLPIPVEVKKDKDLILFIVRGWKYSNNELKAELELAKRLNKNGKKIKFMLFNLEADIKCKKIIERESNFEILVYDENNYFFFLEQLKKSSLVITQRAHGAIIASILGVPTVCLGIEIKLKNIHLMLKNSSVYFDYPLNTDKMEKIIMDEKYLEKLENNISIDIIKNSKAIDELVESLKINFNG